VTEDETSTRDESPSTMVTIEHMFEIWSSQSWSGAA
jgi:hypothetical protein